jgi:glutamate dehydrogenase/leucine dehydrogenase
MTVTTHVDLAQFMAGVVGRNPGEVEFHQAEKPWHIPGDIAPPCATQNELDLVDAQALINNGVILVAEGANMPCTTDAINLFRKARITFGPAKAANLGMNPNYTNYCRA